MEGWEAGLFKENRKAEVSGGRLQQGTGRQAAGRRLQKLQQNVLEPTSPPKLGKAALVCFCKMVAGRQN